MKRHDVHRAPHDGNLYILLSLLVERGWNQQDALLIHSWLPDRVEIFLWLGVLEKKLDASPELW